MKTGAVVRVAGKEVGKVTSIEFAGAEIEVSLQLSKEIRPLITDKSVANIGSLSLLGEPIVDITPAQAGRPLADWAYVRGITSKGAVAEVADSALKGLSDASQLIADVRAGKGTVGKMLTDDALYTQLRELTTASAEVVRNLQKGKGTLGSLANDDAVYRSLKASVDNLQLITDRVNRGDGPLGRLLHDDALGAQLSSTMGNIDQMTDKLNKGQGSAARFINDRELYDRFNSVGQLLNDKQLYDHLNQAATELTNLISDIRKDPKKYLNVRVSIF
jgi:phospholipid/cholesterol/gamma-HCH transport system substrate-binding protein